MLRLNRKTEYALLALHFLAQRGEGGATSVRSIAASCRIPEVLLAKILQRLKHAGIVRSMQGAAGGYVLARDPAEIPFWDFVGLFDDHTSLVECVDPDAEPCPRRSCCTLREPLGAFDAALRARLRDLSLNDLFSYSPSSQ